MPLAQHKRTPTGSIVVRAHFTRCGVFEYRQEDGSIRRELRHPNEVFDSDSLDSLADLPVIGGRHTDVLPDNWRQTAIGHVAGRAVRGPMTIDGDALVSGYVCLSDGAAIARAEHGDLKEVSCAYEYDFDPTPGTWQGQRYDGIQRQIRYTHVALGPRGWGRAGNEVQLVLVRDAIDEVLAWPPYSDDEVKSGSEEKVKTMIPEQKVWRTEARENFTQDAAVTAAGAGDTDDPIEQARKDMDARKRDAWKKGKRDAVRGKTQTASEVAASQGGTASSAAAAGQGNGVDNNNRGGAPDANEEYAKMVERQRAAFKPKKVAR